RRVGRIDPCIPDGVHFGKVIHIGEPDRGLQDSRLVGTRSHKQALDFCQCGLGLLGHADASLSDLPCEIDSIAMDYRLAHARTDFYTANAHCELLSKCSVDKSLRKQCAFL